MNKYKELIVWKHSVDLAAAVYQITEKFPSKEAYGLISQINRSVVSVASNIAEGAGRNSKKEFDQFLGVALGSVYELETQLIIGKRIGYLSEESFAKLQGQIESIIKMLIKLKQSVKRDYQPKD